MPKKLRRPGPVFLKNVSLAKLESLLKASKSQAEVLGILGDVARVLAKRLKKFDREGSHTTCIACGRWIPVDREERGQHTCSEPCQNWYRRLRRAMQASKYCRYCGRPNGHPDAVIQRRPGRPRTKAVQPETEPGKNNGATGLQYATEPKIEEITSFL